MTNYATFNGSPFDQRPKSNRHRNFQYADSLPVTQAVVTT